LNIFVNKFDGTTSDKNFVDEIFYILKRDGREK